MTMNHLRAIALPAFACIALFVRPCEAHDLVRADGEYLGTFFPDDSEQTAVG